LGWDFLSACLLALLHQKDPALILSDVFSSECIEEAKKDCQVAPRVLTVRFFLNKNREASVNDLCARYNLKPTHITGQDARYSTFFYGTTHKVHFTIIEELSQSYLTTIDSLQIKLDPLSFSPSINDYSIGNTWCLDSMLRVLRVVGPSNNLGKILFRYKRNGFESPGFREVWQSFSWDEREPEERRLQNVLFRAQCALQAGKVVDCRPLLATEIDSKKGFWHACGRLLASGIINYEELELVLQYVGSRFPNIAKSTFLGFRAVSFRSTTSGNECVYNVAIRDINIDPLVSRVQRADAFNDLIASLVDEKALTGTSVRALLKADLRKSLFSQLVQGRWKRLCVETSPDLVREAFQEDGAAKKALLDGENEYLTVLQEHLLDFPEELEALQARVALTKRVKTQVLEAAMRAHDASQHVLALRLFKVHGSVQSCKMAVLESAESALPHDLVDWYVGLVGQDLPYKLLPARQYALLERVGRLEDHRKALEERMPKPAVQPAKKPTAKPKVKEDPRAPLRAAAQQLKSGNKESARGCVENLLVLGSQEALDAAFRLLGKFFEKDTKLWERAFRVVSANFDLSVDVAVSVLLRMESVGELWRPIFAHPAWISSKVCVQIAEKIEEIAFHVEADALTDIFESSFDDLKTKKELALGWYWCIPDPHPKKVQCGLRVLGLLGQPDIETGCRVIESMFVGFESLFQDGKPSQKRGNFSDKLVAFCKAAQWPEVIARTEETLVRVVVRLGQYGTRAAHRFAVEQFAQSPSLEVVRALEPSATWVVTQAEKDAVAALAAGVIVKIFSNSDLDKLLQFYECKFRVMGVDPLRQKRLPLLLAGEDAAVKRYSEQYKRLIQLALDSKNPDHALRVLTVDIYIRCYHKNQATQIAKVLPDWPQYSRRLLVKVIGSFGWCDSTQLLFRHHLSFREQDVVYTPFYICASRGFYSSNRNPLTPETVVGTLCPPMGAQHLTEMHEFSRALLDACSDPEISLLVKDRLTNCALQTIRNAVEYAPELESHYELVERLAYCYEESDIAVFPHHAMFICALLRRVKPPQDPARLERLLAYLSLEADQLTVEDVDSLSLLHRALDRVSPENVEITLLAQAVGLLIWQDVKFVSAFAARQKALDHIFRVWEKYPQVIVNEAQIRTLLSVRVPNALYFGMHRGPLGQKAALDAQTSYLQMYLRIFRSGQEDNRIASHSFSMALQVFRSNVKEGLYDDQFDTLFAHAQDIMGLFHYPNYFSIQALVKPAQKFTKTLLLWENREEKIRLLHAWLTVLLQYKPDPQSGQMLAPVISMIVDSDIHRQFDLDAYVVLLACVDMSNKEAILVQTREYLTKNKLTDYELRSLYALVLSLKDEPEGKRLTESCLKTMIEVVKASKLDADTMLRFGKMVTEALFVSAPSQELVDLWVQKLDPELYKETMSKLQK
jgi:hypothetical protein